MSLSFQRRLGSLRLTKIYCPRNESGNYLKTSFGLPFLSPTEIDNDFVDGIVSTRTSVLIFVILQITRIT